MANPLDLYFKVDGKSVFLAVCESQEQRAKLLDEARKLREEGLTAKELQDVFRIKYGKVRKLPRNIYPATKGKGYVVRVCVNGFHIRKNVDSVWKAEVLVNSINRLREEGVSGPEIKKRVLHHD